MEHEAEIIDIAERLALAIEDEVGDLRFGMDNPVPANYVKWACLSVIKGYFLTPDWACDWIRHGYPEPPKWLCATTLRGEGRVGG